MSLIMSLYIYKIYYTYIYSLATGSFKTSCSSQKHCPVNCLSQTHAVAVYRLPPVPTLKAAERDEFSSTS